MATIQELLSYIEEKHRDCRQLSHASNILKKFYNKKTSANQRNALTIVIPAYVNYLDKMLKITDYGDAAIKEKCDCLNEYYNTIHSNNLDNSFSAQGKFRPTILEEFLYLLFKDYLADVKKNYDHDNRVSSGSVKAYSNIYFKAKDFPQFIASPVIGKN